MTIYYLFSMAHMLMLSSVVWRRHRETLSGAILQMVNRLRHDALKGGRDLEVRDEASRRRWVLCVELWMNEWMNE